MQIQSRCETFGRTVTESRIHCAHRTLRHSRALKGTHQRNARYLEWWALPALRACNPRLSRHLRSVDCMRTHKYWYAHVTAIPRDKARTPCITIGEGCQHEWQSSRLTMRRCVQTSMHRTVSGFFDFCETLRNALNLNAAKLSQWSAA